MPVRTVTKSSPRLAAEARRPVSLIGRPPIYAARVRVDRLALQNFRSFVDEAFDFEQPITVLIGDNGTGKTALLDALAVAVGAFLIDIAPGAARTIRRSDVRIARYSLAAGVVNAEPQIPTVVSAAGNVNGRPISWTRALRRLEGRTDRAGAAEIRE